MLGLEHADTLNSMTNLASKFWNQGRLKEAKELEVRVMETRKRVLGLEHPETLNSINNLAWTFWSLDMKKEAIQLMSEMVQYREKRLALIIPILSNQYVPYRNGGMGRKLNVCQDGSDM